MGRLVPDHKTIADFRKDNGGAIRQVCVRFVALCRAMGLLIESSVAIDGSKFKAVNNRSRTSLAPRWTGAWRRLAPWTFRQAPRMSVFRGEADINFGPPNVRE